MIRQCFRYFLFNFIFDDRLMVINYMWCRLCRRYDIMQILIAWCLKQLLVRIHSYGFDDWLILCFLFVQRFLLYWDQIVMRLSKDFIPINFWESCCRGWDLLTLPHTQHCSLWLLCAHFVYFDIFLYLMLLWFALAATHSLNVTIITVIFFRPLLDVTKVGPLHRLLLAA